MFYFIMNEEKNMKSKTSLKKILINTVHSIFLAFELFVMWFCAALTPYADWAITTGEHGNYIDPDKMFLYKALCFVLLVLNSVIAVVARRYSKFFFIMHLLITQCCIGYYVYLILI